MKSRAKPKTSREKQFNALIGKTIVEIDASAVNQVILIDAEGNRHAIDAEVDGQIRLPIIELTTSKR